jgi:hypothetical protein
VVIKPWPASFSELPARQGFFGDTGAFPSVSCTPSLIQPSPATAAFLVVRHHAGGLPIVDTLFE